MYSSVPGKPKVLQRFIETMRAMFRRYLLAQKYNKTGNIKVVYAHAPKEKPHVSSRDDDNTQAMVQQCTVILF